MTASSSARVREVSVVAALLLLSACFFFAAVFRASTIHLWLDETLAVATGRLGSFGAIWTAIWNGIEFSPPTYGFLLHILMTVTGDDSSRLLPRIPSILGAFGAALCVYALLRPNLSRIGAVVAFGLVLNSGLFEYAVQARQYALLAFGTALSLLIWTGFEETARPYVRASMLWIVLSLCICLHFYGVVTVGVVGVAELLWLATRRRIRWNVWVALSATGLTLAAWYPLAARLATFNSADHLSSNFYGRPTLSRLLDAAVELLIGGRPGTLLFLACGALAASAYFLKRTPLSYLSDERPPAFEPPALLTRIELVMLALCAIPIIAFALSFFVTKTFSPRYMSSVALLPGIAAGYLIDKLSVRKFVAVGVVLLTAAQLIQRSTKYDSIQTALAVVESRRSHLPIVIGEGLLFAELMHAADAATRSRLVYLLTPPGLVSPDTTNENIVKRLAVIRPEYQVRDPAQFTAENGAFYLVARPQMSTDTTTRSLLDRGLVGALVAEKEGVLVFKAGEATRRPGD